MEVLAWRSLVKLSVAKLDTLEVVFVEHPEIPIAAIATNSAS